MRAVLLDVDGTLMDANYHHALAWYRAFRAHGIVLPLWRIHRHVGMGGDQLIPALVGDGADEDALSDARKQEYRKLIDEVSPLESARELIEDLKDGGHPTFLASSAPQDELDHYLDVLDARELVDGWTTDDDVESTKPEPDLVRAALDKAGTDDAVLVGDTPWDVEAGRKAGIQTVAVMTGGFSEQELREAGAVAVHESLTELRAHLGEPPFV
jgi:HAD superfamily hydrolase (TIGR01549 family)